MVLLLLSLSLIIFLFSSYIAITYKGYGYLPVFFSSYFIFILIIPAYFHIINNVFPFYGMSYSSEHQLYASLILLVFSIFFWFGFFVDSSNNKIIQKNNSYNYFKINNYRFFVVQYICIFFILMSVVIFGIESFLVKRGEFDRSVFGEESMFRELFLNGIKSLSFASLFYLIIYKKYLTGLLWCFTILLSLLLFLIVNYPLSLPRFVLFSYLIAFYCYYFKPSLKAKLIVILSFAFGITTLFPYISYLTRGDGDFKFDIFNYYQSSGDFDGFQSIINTVIFVEKHGYTFGNQIISSFLSFIPRSLWLNKGEPTGSIAAESAGYDFLNISSPMPAEFYIDFGYVGLIFFSFFFGWFIRFLDKKIKNYQEINLSYILSIIIISLIVIVARGPILGVLNNVYIEIFIFSILYWLFFLKFKIR